MIFNVEERASDSPFVDLIWRTRSEGDGSFVSRAVSQWEMVVTTYQGKTTLTVRGPETRAALAPCPAHAEFFGIQFKLGTFMPHFPMKHLVDGATNLPEATAQSFWLHHSAWPFPNFDHAETFVEQLVRSDLLVLEPIVDAALRGQLPERSLRSVQRRFLQATGLTHRTIHQIARAQQAADRLEQGMSILDTVEQTGYADQSHLTRSLKRFIGQTPAQLRSERFSGDASKPAPPEIMTF